MSTPIGPLLACAVADAYGAGFEFGSTAYIKKHNRMESYIPHPRFQRPEGTYTDDTQMALGLAEHLLAEGVLAKGVLTSAGLAARWVECFKRDPRTGYSQGFYTILQNVSTWAELQATLTPHSTKNGGAMRAFPCGFLPTPEEVRDKAMFQASLTHATYGGMHAAAAAALMFHFCYYQEGTLGELGDFLAKWLPGTDWTVGTAPRGEPTGGVPTVQKAIGVLLRCQSLADAIQMSVALGGDTDTVAAIVAPSAAVCTEVRNAVPPFLLDKLENGTYGRDYLVEQDRLLLEKYPRLGSAPAPVRKVKPPAKLNKAEGPAGPLDFLFND